MTPATAIPLELWPNPQGDRVLVFSEGACSVFFGCWSARGVPADFIGELVFQGASAARSFGREFSPYRIEESSRSILLKVDDSEFLREHLAYRHAHHPQGPASSLEPVHHVVIGHDVFHEVLAAGFTVRKIPNAEVTDPRLRRLIEEV